MHRSRRPPSDRVFNKQLFARSDSLGVLAALLLAFNTPNIGFQVLGHGMLERFDLAATHSIHGRESLYAPHWQPRAASRCSTVVANVFPDKWMNELGTATNSKKKWARPMNADTLGPGSVILANEGSFDHYFLESLVLILEHGEEGTRGILLNHETPWKVEDLSPTATEQFAANKVFLGGDAGRDTMVMIHGESMLPGATEVGRGIYQGGVTSASQAVSKGALPSSRFKFFYKTVEFLPNALQMQINSGIFRLIELSPAWLFGQSGQREMWKDVVNKLKEAGADMSAPEQKGLHYEQDGLTEEARMAAVSAAKKAERQKAKEDEEAARLDHDAKVKAFVEQLKRENAAKAKAETEAESTSDTVEAEAESTTEAVKVSVAGIEELVDYRFHLGNDQWRVRWKGEGPASDTWETWNVLDTESLQEHADLLREKARQKD